MECRLLLNVVVREGTAVLELLAREDETLLVRGNALLILDLRLDIIDRIRGLDLERDGLARQSLDEDLHGDCGKWSARSPGGELTTATRDRSGGKRDSLGNWSVS